MKKKPTTLTLDSDQAAMIFKQGEVPVILIPDQHEKELVQEHVLLCVKLAMAIQDDECMAYIEKRFDEICDEEEEEEKNNENRL